MGAGVDGAGISGEAARIVPSKGVANTRIAELVGTTVSTVLVWRAR